MSTTDTDMGAAMRRAGFDTGSRLYAVMAHSLAEDGCDMARSSKALWQELLGDEELRTAGMMALLSVPLADMVGAVIGMSGKGQHRVADEGHGGGAPPRQQNGGGAGHHVSAENGQGVLAGPSPTERETGAMPNAPKGQASTAPARGLSEGRRAAKGYMALKSARAVSHLGWLANATIPQGPRIIDLRWRDVPPMVDRMRRELGKNAQVTVALMAIEAQGKKQGVFPPDDHWIDHMPTDITRFISDRTEKDTLGEMAVDWFNAYGRTMLNTMMEDSHAT